MILQSQKILLIGKSESLSTPILEVVDSIGAELSVLSYSEESLVYLCDHVWDVLIIHADDQRSFTINTCKYLREQKPFCQIIVVSEKVDVDFSASVLNSGADDCTVFPWNKAEFTARINVAIKRSQRITGLLEQQSGAEFKPAAYRPENVQQSGSDPARQLEKPPGSEGNDAEEQSKTAYKNTSTTSESGWIYLGDVGLSVMQREITVAGEVLRLTDTEFSLLTYLFERNSRPCSSVELLNNVLGYTDENYLPSLHSHVSRIRRKLKNSKTTTIETIWCYGYRVEIALSD